MVDGKKEKQTGLNLEEIKKLIDILEKSHLEEIEVSYGEVHLRLAKPMANQYHSHEASQAVFPVSIPQAAVQSAHHAPAQKPAEPAVPALSPTAHEVKSPMVGTFYRAPSPNAEPFVKVGDVVKKGQTLCIIEAMKLMNEIECEADGKVVAIKVQNAEPVEYGEVLLIIDSGV
jgi:acetyl-CoA carboxylase biotin carboxyl carrier protein